MERYEEGALRSDAAYVRQRHLCVHCPIGLRFMELEKRKPCLYQQRELREIILSTRCTHTRCRGENIVRTHSEARSLRPRGGGRITIPRVCTTGDTRGGRTTGSPRGSMRGRPRVTPRRAGGARTELRVPFTKISCVAHVFSVVHASRSRRGLSGGERAESGRRIVDRARRGRGGGLGRLPLRREAPARANGGERAAVGQTRASKGEGPGRCGTILGTMEDKWTTARRGTAAGRTERAAAERRFRPGRMLSILCWQWHRHRPTATLWLTATRTGTCTRIEIGFEIRC